MTDLSSTALTLDHRLAIRGGHRLGHGLADITALVRRNLLVAMRMPETIVFGVVQPLMLLVLFVYVFGGAVDIPGVSYIQYVVPAVLVQTAAFAGIGTAVGIAADLQKGMVDRFRSLPIARSAVLAGRTLADAVQLAVRLLLVVGVALAMGFRFEGGWLAAVCALGVAVIFGFAMSWIFVAIGLLVRNEEAASAASFVWVFPLVFVSSAYVPVDTLPSWLQPVARLNPITAASDAVRALAFGGEATEPLLRTLIWSAALVLIFGSLAVRMYRKTA
jgi:ABC-2 type transport system permease protein